MQVYPYGCANSVDSVHSDPSEKEDAQSSFNCSFKQGYGSMHCCFNCSFHPFCCLISRVHHNFFLPIVLVCHQLIILLLVFLLEKVEFIHHLLLVRPLILKLLPVKQVRIILKMGMVIRMWHHAFTSKYSDNITLDC